MTNPKYSIIIPVYNRPDEVDELINSLVQQKYDNYEVIVVEDGSDVDCKEIINRYNSRLTIKYFFKPNSGPGTTRNYGAERATGDYFIFFDSDCIIPEHYFQEVDTELEKNSADAFGGPDKAHQSFSSVQKAINYSMTSFFTTGGIRGGKERLDKFFPRSFNMGISKEAFAKTDGFSHLRFGEDIDFSIRILKNGFTTRLFQKAYVYHKRRTDFRKFYKQVYNSGIARINLHLIHPGSLKFVHLLPSTFVIGMILMIAGVIITPFTLLIPAFYSMLVFAHSMLINGSITVAFLSIPAAWVQLFGYGLGFLSAVWKRLILNRKEYQAFEKNFYN